MNIAIIAALENEISIIKDKLADKQVQTISNINFHTGKISGHTITVAKCGMGKVSAALVSQIAIDYFRPDLMINTGCAGALQKNLQIGDIVMGKTLVEWDLDTTDIGDPKSWIQELNMVKLYSDRDLSNKLKECIHNSKKSFGKKVYDGLIASGDRFVASQEVTDYIFKYFPDALCAEMEGAAVAHVATQNNIPFCVIRTMSDTADGDSGVDYWDFSKVASEQSAEILINLFKEL
ncbi:MAG: 5'-methylthioadenosine/adenosylhomocysteine nucleosidase [Coriobacteriia bacterium]|nr:5'-methylthioadenosine/adenosylhomocysteine nucleosidase [Coriobacteriia bacterium]